MLSWIRHRCWPVIRRTVQQWNEDDGNTLAAATAFYVSLSFLPLLLVLIGILGFALRFSPSLQNAEQQLLSIIAQDLSADFAERAQVVLQQVKQEASVGGPVGFLVLLVVVYTLFYHVDYALIRIMRIKPPQYDTWAVVRTALIDRLKAFLLMCLLGVIVIGAFVGSLALSGIQAAGAARRVPPLVLELLEIGGTLAVNVTALTLVYRMPRGHWATWREVAVGAVVAAVGWELGRQVLARFVITSKYSAYGIVGSFMAIMLWTYYASMVLLLGAELTQALSVLRKPQHE